MKLIVGLGNPGKKYTNTRHNVGFLFIDKFAQKLGLELSFDRKFNADIVKNEKWMLLKPQTFMNLSGESIKKVMDYFEFDIEDLIVIHDEVDLDFGVYKIQQGRGDAGHNGVKSVIKHLGSNNFTRARIGVGKPLDPNFTVDKFVLSSFSDSELNDLDAIFNRILDDLKN